MKIESIHTFLLGAPRSLLPVGDFCRGWGRWCGLLFYVGALGRHAAAQLKSSVI